MICVPSEPLQVNFAARGNVHRFINVSPSVALLEPGRSDLVMGLVILATAPIVLVVCWRFHLPLPLLISLPLIPVIASAAHVIAYGSFVRFGTRACFDRSDSIVTVSGARHRGVIRIPAGAIRAVQLCEVKIKQGSGFWRAIQVNLVVENPDISRINLLQSGSAHPLQHIAKQIAGFLGVPLYQGSTAV